MRLLVTAAQMRAIERASAVAGVATPQLMEHAGTALAEAARRRAAVGGRFFIVCGRGNNGGDGLVAARVLDRMRRTVHCELLPGALEKMPAEARGALEAFPESLRLAAIDDAALKPRAGDVVIDALFGTGLSRAPAGEHADAIRRIQRWREAGAIVVSADVPSGLSADTGQAFEPCVRADVTVCFGHAKVGVAVEPGLSLAGVVEVAPIGLPADTDRAGSVPRTFLVEESDARGALAPRRSDTHKGTYGHVLVVAGSSGKSGAAILAARAALRSGAGLVTLASGPSTIKAAVQHTPELMGVALNAWSPLGPKDLPALLEAAEGKDALLIGPGIARGDQTAELLSALLRKLEIPIVLDADALNAIGGDRKLTRGARPPLIVTPHPGEMGRLLGISTAEVQRDRLSAARAFAYEGGPITILKGARTVIAQNDGTAWINPTGNPGMATGGTGDVLGGVIAALLAQGLKPIDAAITGTYAHGLAGDLAAARSGQLGLIASDVIEALREVWTRWQR